MPSFGDMRIGRTVKSAVDLYGVEKAAVIFKFAFNAWGVKVSVPGAFSPGIRPS